MQRSVNNKFLLLTILIAMAILTMGASSWLIINENSNSPIFKVQKLELNCEESEVLSPIYYGANEQPTVTAKAVVKYGNETVTGSWVVPNVSLKETSCAVDDVNKVSESEIVICNEDNTVEVVFTADNSEYGTLTVEVPVPIKAVVYKGGINSPQIYYSNIEKALADGSGSGVDKFFVIPNLKQTNNSSALFTPTISKNSTIYAGDILSLRIGEIIDNYNDASATAEPECTVSDTSATRNLTFRDIEAKETASTSSQTFADSWADSANRNYLKTNVIINANVTLTVSNGATLFVAGSVGSSGTGIVGFTSRNYSQITLGSNAQIKNEGGTIDCLGFIKESATNNGSKITNNGDIYNPFVVYDYRGGKSTVGAYLDGQLGLGDIAKLLAGGVINITPGPEAVFPFSTFDCPNIQVETETFFGHNVYGYTDIYTGALSAMGIDIPAKHNMTIVTIIGKSGNNPIIELGNNSSIKVKYAPKSAQNTITIGQPAKARQEDGRTTLNIYGNATLGTVSLKVSVVNATVNITSNSVFFPITWKYNVILNDADNNPSNGNSTFNINVPTKFMSGSSLTVNKGAALNISDEVIFYNRSVTYDYNTYQTVDSADVFCDKVPYSRAGDHYIEGTDPPGGNYPGGKEEAKCIVNGSLNVTSTGRIGGKVLSETAGASLVLANVNSITSLDGWGTFETTGSGDFVLSDSTTRQPTGDIYSTNSTDLAVTTYYSIPEDGGYSWIARDNEFEINYVINQDGVENKPQNLSSFTPESPRFDLQNLDNVDNVRFGGWYLDSSLTKQIFYIDSSAMQYVVDNTLTLYAKWSESHEITFVGGKVDLTGIGNVDFADENGFYNPYNTTQPKVMDMTPILTASTDNLGIDYYWDGNWYFDAECTRMIPKDGYTFTGDTAIYAGWADKVNVTFDYDSGYDFTNGILGSLSATIYLNPEQAQAYNIASYTTAVSSKDEDPNAEQYFNGWLVENATLTSDTLTANINATTVTLTADWVNKVQIILIWKDPKTDDADYAPTGKADDSGSSTIYYKRGAKIYAPDLPTAVSGHSLDYWTATGNTSGQYAKDAPIQLTAASTADLTLTATLVINTYTIQYGNNGTVKVNGTTVSSNSRHAYGTILTIEANNRYEIKDTTNLHKITDTTYHLYGDASVTFGACFAAGTLITLADGTQKAIEYLTEDDIVLAFDHMSGEYVAISNLFIINNGYSRYRILKLYFSDGTTFDIIVEHGLFDMTTNKYEMISYDNVENYIGHEFYTQSNDQLKTTTLVNYTINEVETTCYSLMTPVYINHFANGLLCVSDDIEGLYNYFEYGEGLKYDEEQMQADIEKYGLFTYEEWADIFSYEEFVALNVQYGKIAIAKGLMTYEDIFVYIEKYLSKFRD